MTRVSAILLALLLPCLGHAQTEEEGVVRYLMTQNWIKKMESVDYISKQQKEKMSYMWGNNSEWKTYANLFFKGQETLYLDSEEEAQEREWRYSGKKETFYIWRDYANNKVKDAIGLQGTVYLIEDSIAAPNWKILNEMKEVMGHVCMNATYTDTTTKRNFVAWFALDMPMNGGPERFSGLPGLILEVEVDNGAVIFTADKIEKKSVAKEMVVPQKKKLKKTTEAGYNAAIKAHFDERRKNQEPPFWGIRW
jgi:GLPGLI family protein